jgi:hypothetical protein
MIHQQCLQRKNWGECQDPNAVPKTSKRAEGITEKGWSNEIFRPWLLLVFLLCNLCWYFYFEEQASGFFTHMVQVPLKKSTQSTNVATDNQMTQHSKSLKTDE